MPYASLDQKRDYQRRWAAARRARYLDGRSCVHCGSPDDLHVHHCDETRKDSHRIWTWAEPRLLAELEKCEVLCGPCHRRLHADRQRVPCGTQGAYRRGCRCELCREAKRLSRRGDRPSFPAKSDGNRLGFPSAPRRHGS